MSSPEPQHKASFLPQKPKSSKGFWHDHLPEELASIAPSVGHLGHYYRDHGMKIDINQPSTQATNLLKVMNAILAGLIDASKKTDNGDPDLKSVAPDQEMKLGTSESTENEHEKQLKLYKKQLKEYQEIYDERENHPERPLNAVLSPQENTIRAAAASLLALTNGHDKLAQDVLKIGGLKAMLSMKPEEQKALQGSLDSAIEKSNAARQC